LLKHQKAKLAIWAKEVNCDYCQELRLSTLIHNNGGLVRPDAKSDDFTFSDVCGSLPTKSLGGARYFVAFIDGVTRFVTFRLMKNKNEVTHEFVKFKTNFEKQNNTTIKRLHSDNGVEFVNEELESVLEEDGIERTTSAPYDTTSTGMAERINRNLMNAVRTLLTAESL
jgi:transposase InsO family protein